MKQLTFKAMMALFLAAAVLSLSSCSKKKLEKATASAEDNNLAESLFSDIFNESSAQNKQADDDLAQTKTGSTFGSLIDTCADVTWTPNADSTYVASVIIDYGTGCVYNGRTREGKILITRDGPWFEAGTNTTITTENFYIDDYKVEGTKTITTTQATIKLTSPFVTASFDVVVQNGIVTCPDGDILTWESSRTHTWTLEQLLPLIIYLRVDGSANGTNRDGVDYTIDITKTLVAKFGCRYIIEGILKITSDDVNKEITIDYGDGTCDGDATITVGNKNAENLAL
ncbi:MAG: hypothetical protein ABII90_16035 [Bacteroidota bacterium]